MFYYALPRGGNKRINQSINSCLGLACPLDGTDKMEVEFGNGKSRSFYRSHAYLVDVEDQYVQ